MSRILCIGDSNTYGYDPRSYFGDRYPEDLRWTGLLQKAGWEIINCGQNGREIPAREAQPLDLVTVMLGANDLLQHSRYAAEDVTARMETFLSYLIATLPGVRFLLIVPPPMRSGAWVNEDRLPVASARLGKYYREVAARLGIAFADSGEWDVGLCFDGVHFTPEGHRAFAEGMLTALQQQNR